MIDDRLVLAFLRDYAVGGPLHDVRFESVASSGGFELRVSRGTGVTFQFGSIDVSRASLQSDVARRLERLVDEINTMVWIWDHDNKPGVAGKWRKFGRAA